MLLGSFKETLCQDDNLFVEMLFVKKTYKVFFFQVEKKWHHDLSFFSRSMIFFAYLFFIFISGAIGPFDDGIGANIEFFCVIVSFLDVWVFVLWENSSSSCLTWQENITRKGQINFKLWCWLFQMFHISTRVEVKPVSDSAC